MAGPDPIGAFGRCNAREHAPRHPLRPALGKQTAGPGPKPFAATWLLCLGKLPSGDHQMKVDGGSLRGVLQGPSAAPLPKEVRTMYRAAWVIGRTQHVWSVPHL